MEAKQGIRSSSKENVEKLRYAIKEDYLDIVCYFDVVKLVTIILDLHPTKYKVFIEIFTRGNCLIFIS